MGGLQGGVALVQRIAVAEVGQGARISFPIHRDTERYNP